MTKANRIRLSALSIFIITVVLFSLGLSNQEITAFDSRFYLFAQEMLRYGWSWFPTTHGQWYPDYPATSTWMIVGLSSLFGLSKATAVFPTICCAALTLSFTYLIGSLQRERLGWAAVFFLLLTLFVMRTIRSISLDMMITAITTMTFYLVHASNLSSRGAFFATRDPHQVSESGDPSSQKALLGMTVLFLLGFLIRGPIGLVMPVGVMCAYYAASGQFKLMMKRGCIALLLLIFCVLGLVLLAYHVGGVSFIQDVLRMQIFGRLEAASLPRYFYFKDSFGSYALAYPIAIFVLWGVIWQRLKTGKMTADMHFILLLSSWVFIILLGMSVPSDKKVRYILPMLPACALIAATFYTSEERWFLWFKKLLMTLFFILPTMFLSIVFWVKYTNEIKSLSLPVHFNLCIIIFILMQILQCVLWRKDLLFIAASSFTFFYLFVMEPVQLHIDRGREVVHEIERMRKLDHAKLIFYKENEDGLPIKYIINMTNAEQPLFIKTIDELKAFHEPVYVVTSTSYSDDIELGLKEEYQKRMTTKIAHVDIVVFTRRNAHE